MAKDTATTSRFKKPSEAPAPGTDSWNFTSDENDGGLFIITPTRLDEVETKKYGKKSVVVADIVELNRKKPTESVEHKDVFVFPAYIQNTLKPYVATDQLLGTLEKIEDAAAGKGFHWELIDADDDDLAVAEKYFDALNPFAKKEKSKPVADPKAEKKAKKKK